jgi:hypothetical protein
MSLEGGKTSVVRIGGKGRTVIGRVVDAKGEALTGAAYGLGSFDNQVPEVEEPAEMKAKFEALLKLPPEEVKGAYEAFQKSPEVVALKKAEEEREAKMRWYSFVVGGDGAFRVEDVDAGEYILSVSVTEAKTGKEVGKVEVKVVVPTGEGEVRAGDLKVSEK